MKKILIFILCVAILFPAGSSIAAEDITSDIWREFYVSSDASENGDGSKENPFNSIEKAQEKIRTINDEQAGDIVVNIAHGEYELAESLFFNVSDSGKNGYRIIYRGNKEAPPVISGGKKVSGFELFDAQKNIYRTTVSDIDEIREIYVNGQRRYVAQTNLEIRAEKKPDKYTTLEYYGANPLAPKNDYTYYNPETVYQYDGFYVSKKYIDIFENQKDMEIFWNDEFREAIFHVDEIKQDPEREDVVIVTLKQNAYDLLMKNPGYFELPPFGGFWVRNAYELLDSPGEFYFNKDEKMLYYMPLENENMENAEVVVPRLERLMSLVGNNDDDRVKNISFEYLEFAYSTWLSHVDTDWYTWQGPQSLFYTNTLLDAAVRVFISDNIDFLGNVFHSTGASAIDMNNNVINSDILGNCFYDIGATTVHIGNPNTRNYHCALTRKAYPQHGSNGELLNLLTDVDSNVTGSFFGEYDNWSVAPSENLQTMGTLRGGLTGHNYMNGFYQSFITENDYSRFTGAWQNDPYAPEKGEKSWVRYDMLDRYTIDEITLIFDEAATTAEQRCGFEVLLSNNRFFKEGTYYKVAEQTTDAGANVSYPVDTDDKYRFLMIRTVGATPLALTYAAATTKDRTTFYQFGECKNIRIENNYMERIGLNYPNATGLFVMHGNNIEVNHNYIKDTPYSGMSLGWSWGMGSQATYDENGNYIENSGNSNGVINAGFNRVENSAQKAVDGGAIYTLGGFQSGSSVHDNYVYNSGIGYRAYYLDNGTSRIDVYNNVAEDVYAFTSAAYDGNAKSEGINLYNNFSTNSVTHSADNPTHRPQAVYPWGQHTEDVYNIVSQAGLEKEYTYLEDIPCEGYFNLPDEDIVYNHGVRLSFTAKMADALIESANLILSEGKFGEGLGEYPYDTYYRIKQATEKFESVSSYSTSDVFAFRKLLREAGESFNRKTPEETLELCEKLLSEAQTFEKTPVEGKYPLKAVEDFKAEINRYKALENKADYSALKILEDAYNSFLTQKAAYNVSYIYAPEMKNVCIDNETDEITMFFNPGENLSEVTLGVHAAKGAAIADIFEKIDISEGLQIPVFNEIIRNHKIKNLNIMYDSKDSEKTNVLSKNAFIEADDGVPNIQNFNKGILLTPSDNAITSYYYSEINAGLRKIKLKPLSTTGYTEFSLLFGADSKNILYKNARTSDTDYIETVFKDGYVELYIVNNNTKKFIDKKKYDIRNDVSYVIEYSAENVGSDTAFKLCIDGNTVFDTLVNGNITSDSWGYWSTVNSLYVM